MQGAGLVVIAATLAADLLELLAALFKLGCGLFVAGDDLCAQVLGFEFGLGGGKLGAHAGRAVVDGLQVAAQLCMALGLAAGRLGAALALAFELGHQFLGLLQLVANLVGRAGVVFGALGFGAFDVLAEGSQALELGLGCGVERGLPLVLGQHAQGLQHQG